MNENPNIHKKRTLVIGDVHGCSKALLDLEKTVQFTTHDQIIFLGDYVDRGPGSKEVIDWLIEKKNHYNLITLLGNHEVMMENASADLNDYIFWSMNGGQNALLSFGCDLEDIPQKYWDFFDECKLYHETEQYIFVHAGAKPNEPIADQDIDSLCWIRFRDLEPHQSKKIIVCGHTPQQGYRPKTLPYGICIDTHAFHPNGFLTCLDIETGDYWQASNHKNRTRKGKINLPALNE